MKTIVSTATLALLLSACASSPEAACEEYIDAATTCISEAYGDTTGTALDAQQAALDGACAGADSLSGSARSAYVDQMNCYTELYASGDCSTPEGYTAIATDLPTCL